jgi:hypothetical protein
MREVLDITKALADGNPLRILPALAGGQRRRRLGAPSSRRRPQITQDNKRLREILRMDPEKLCKGQ